MPMTSEELEAEVLQLKKQVDELSWTRDYIAIWKLMSTYSHLYQVLRRSEIKSLFAQKTPGVTVEIEDGGIYEGLEGVEKVFNGILSEKKHMTPGFLGVHMTVNPLLEFNKDRTRAKGVWHSHGSVSFKLDRELTAFWCLGKYDMEYVKEDGKWKFLKFAYRLIYMCPYEKGWLDEAQAASITAGHSEFPPDKPSTWHMPYNRHRINVFQPPPPEPYED